MLRRKGRKENVGFTLVARTAGKGEKKNALRSGGGKPYESSLNNARLGV